MPRYRNLDGHSGVLRFETTPDSITLTFVDGDRYVYTHARPGRADVDRMKALAQAGRGLSTYVARQVRERYERKLPAEPSPERARAGRISAAEPDASGSSAAGELSAASRRRPGAPIRTGTSRPRRPR
ncbi:MAG: hypothetical protein JF586_21665 [Burkholderiales bacterium]|nr:hypothetical protein [Burkholderiales bacterium]